MIGGRGDFDPAAFHAMIEIQADQILGNLASLGQDIDPAETVIIQAADLTEKFIDLIPRALASGMSHDEAVVNALGHAASLVIAMGLRLNRLDPI